uniref:Uncharacterized protein n=1 Tax=Vespula pensylvanica TaxID=30213 RepID=A0A834PD73_VESPE|nr:hypothetical protein H0235_004043 [Vespula pensylvanica]
MDRKLKFPKDSLRLFEVIRSPLPWPGPDGSSSMALGTSVIPHSKFERPAAAVVVTAAAAAEHFLYRYDDRTFSKDIEHRRNCDS